VITSKQLLEEYELSLKTNLGYCEVFKNPNRSEIRACSNLIRFSADAYHEDVYIWKYDAAFHRDVLPEIGLLNRENLVWCIHGVAQNLGSMYKMIDSDSLITMSRSDGAIKKLLGSLLSLDWSWTLRYHLDLEKYLSSLRSNT
jgi:hypothetical protein